LNVSGSPVTGFDSAKLNYTVDSAGSALPTVSALPVDTNSTVAIDQASESNGAVATITVTAQDAATTTVYTVAFARSIVVSAPVVTGSGVVGEVLTAVATTDPVLARVSFAWSVDGEPLESATGSSYTPIASDVGKTLTVTATAELEGYASGTALSAGRVVTAAATPPGPSGPGGEPVGSSSPASPGSVAQTGGKGGGTLSNTGFATGPLSAIALLALLLGTAATMTGIRRRRA
jgi:hypothetical protein